jgi:hypothetical protein
MRQYIGTVGHLTRYRNSYLNTLEFGTNFEFVTGLSNALESRANDVFVQARFRVGDQITLRLINSFENVPMLFFLPKAVPVPAGEYEWTNFNVGVRTFNGRLITLQADVTCCSFYDGSAVAARMTVIFRPSTYFELTAGHEINSIDLPTGEVDIHLPTADAAINITPDMQIALQVQYDNISENFGLSTRYRWEYRPGNELFMGFGQSALISSDGFTGQVTQASIRLGHTFRF